MSATTIHFVRHGKVYNPDHLLYERLPDFHLSDLGRRMAQATAAYLANSPQTNTISAVYSSPLERWCREYRTGGPEALRPRPKGRPRGARSGPKPKPTREQELAEEVAYLRAKVAYLEKVRALRARKSRGASEAPSCDRSQGGDTGSTTC